MKRIACFLFLMIQILCTMGCSSEATQAQPIRFKELPGNITYNDTSISLSSVSFCEVYAAHGYNGYCVATIDRSQLSDDDIYWMLKTDFGETRSELEVNAYLSSEKNSLENERLSKLRTSHDSENIYFMFYTPNVQREHLNDFSIGLQIVMSPEKDLLASTTQYYYYDFDAEEGVDYTNYNSVLSEKEIEILIDALNDRVETLS